MALPPHVIAGIDQDKAYLAHLVTQVKDHRKHDCKMGDQLCPGIPIFMLMDTMNGETARRLLLVAISLAGKGEPLCPGH